MNKDKFSNSIIAEAMRDEFHKIHPKAQRISCELGDYFSISVNFSYEFSFSDTIATIYKNSFLRMDSVEISYSDPDFFNKIKYFRRLFL